MIVMKFGGTSLESAEALARVASIVSTRRASSPFVVVSAMDKTTNELLSIGHAAAEGSADDVRARVARLREYHLREAAPIVGASGGAALEEILSVAFPRDVGISSRALSPRATLIPARQTSWQVSASVFPAKSSRSRCGTRA